MASPEVRHQPRRSRRQDQDDHYEYDEKGDGDGDEDDGQDDHEDEHEEDEDSEQDPEAAPYDEDEQDDDDDLQELFGAFVQFTRAGKKMRSKTKGWRKPPKERGKANPMGQDHPAPTSPPRKPASASIVASTATGKVMPSVTT